MKLRYTKQKRFSHLGQIQPAGEITYSMVVKGPRAVQYEVCGAAHGSVQRESRSVTGLCPRKAR